MILKNLCRFLKAKMKNATHTNKNKLKICSLMCVCNNDCPEHFRTAIKSLIDQSLKIDFINIYVDGPIKPEIEYVINEFSSQDNIFFIRGKKSMGLAYGLNLLIDEGLSKNATYFVRMDADDISDKNRVYKQIKEMQDKNYDLIGSSAIIIDEHNKEIGMKEVECKKNKMHSKFILTSPFIHPSVIFRASIFEKGLRYNINLRFAQDYSLWIDIFKSNFKIANVREPLIFFRQASDFYNRRSISRANVELKLRIKAMIALKIISIKNIIYIILRYMVRFLPRYFIKIAYKTHNRKPF